MAPKKLMKIEDSRGQVVLYKNRLEVRLVKDTVWLSLNQMSDLFERDKSVISRHLHNIFKESELKRNSVVAKFATTGTDGKIYQVEYFSLDAIISVGYRVNSKQGTQFRIWATNVLRRYLLDGYTLNEKSSGCNQKKFAICGKRCAYWATLHRWRMCRMSLKELFELLKNTHER